MKRFIRGIGRTGRRPPRRAARAPVVERRTVTGARVSSAQPDEVGARMCITVVCWRISHVRAMLAVSWSNVPRPLNPRWPHLSKRRTGLREAAPCMSQVPT